MFLFLQEAEVEMRAVSESTDKISPEYDVTEGRKDQATVIDAKEQAKEPQPQQEKEQQKPIPETQLQRDEVTSTTTPEEVNLPTMIAHY